jgi:aryl-alcohol dehydrogenase-like predicted oxidoreductase
VDQREPRPELYGVPYRTTEFNGMPYRRLGTSGLWASNMGIGTWKFGFPETGDGARVDERTAYAIFDRAMELGVTFWDTANRYNNASGNSERLIGRWLRRNPDLRRNVVIATKVCGGMDGRTPNHSGLSRGNILDSVRACLDRLETAHVDLLYWHATDEWAPLDEGLAAVEDLIRQDLVRYFGVSNVSAEELAEVQHEAGRLSARCRPVAVQNRFDVVRGEGARGGGGVLDRCARTGVAFVAYSPLARGLLTERYLDPSKAKPGDRLVDEGTLERDATGPVLAKVRQLADLARAWGIPVSQLALAYMLTLPGMGPAIPSCSSVAQLESNAAAGRLTLTDEQCAQVRAVLAD